MSKALVFLLALLGLALLGRPQEIGDVGYDRPDLDLPNMPIILDAGANYTECNELCLNSTECVAWVYGNANCGGIGASPNCWLKGALPQLVPADCRVSGVKDISLLPPKFHFLPLGSILPQGWLHQQEQIQADGLSGYLSLFWPSINQSAWIGFEGGDDWENVPYWLNGLVPLAYQLNENFLLDQVNRYINYILENQQSDGWLGPTCCDPWPRMPLVFALIQYAEANPSDERIAPAIWAYFKSLRAYLNDHPLASWAKFRWQDLVLQIHWLLENYPQGQEQWLYDFAEQAHNQGFDWGAWFASEDFPTGPCRNPCANYSTHGVNTGQSLKSGGVWYRQSKSSADYDSTYQRVDVVWQYHGLASGIFGCDEHLAGNMPSHGSELCTVVETMFSFEILQAITGDPSFGDRVERLAFNALPATITPDMWAHQYLQQSNEVNSMHLEHYIWVTDGPDSNIYGLEPNYPCCTANFNQGWPKFTSHIFALTGDNGVVTMLYAPSVLNTEINGQPVNINLDTQYPFGDTLTFSIKSSVDFPFYLRIPAWAVNATVVVNGGTSSAAPAGDYYKVQVSSGATVVVLTLPMYFYTERRYNNAISIFYGPLLFALDLPANWTELAHYSFNSSDWQALPLGPWAYAINISDENPAAYLKMEQRPIGKYPFSDVGTPYVVTATGKAVDGWGIVDGAAAPPPPSPVSSTHPTQTLTLLPFGATKLRIAEIPTLATTESK